MGPGEKPSLVRTDADTEHILLTPQEPITNSRNRWQNDGIHDARTRTCT